jgi:vitamin B12 transport system permease protein
LRTLASSLLALLSIAMLGLAAGAVWMLPTMYTGQSLPWLALPLGWLLGRAIRSWIRHASWSAALLAIIATALAATYVSMLTAGAHLAWNMGIDFTDALRTAGGGMLFQVARLTMAPSDIAWFAAGCALAAWAAMSARKPSP